MANTKTFITSQGWKSESIVVSGRTFVMEFEFEKFPNILKFQDEVPGTRHFAGQFHSKGNRLARRVCDYDRT